MLKNQFPILLGSGSNAPAASADVSFNLMGYAHECLYLRCEDAAGVRTEAEIAADFDRFRILIDGKERWNLTPAECVFLREYDGQAFGDTMDDTSGVFVIPLVPSYLQSQELASALRLGTLDLDSCTLLMECSAACGATKLFLYSDVAGQNEPCGMIRSVISRPRTQASTGWEHITDLPRDPAARLARYFINTGATPGVVSVSEGIDYQQNGAPKARAIPGVLSAAMKRAARTALSTYWPVDLMRRGLLQDAVPWAGDPASGHPDAIASHDLGINWSTAPAGYAILDEEFVYIVGAKSALPTATK